MCKSLHTGLTAFLVTAFISCSGPSETSSPGLPVPTADPIDRPAPASSGDEPETFQAKFETSKGDFIVEVTRRWSPNGADHFHELVTSGFYDGCRFFRVVPGFMVQWGINGDPQLQSQWQDNTIDDDPVVQSNKRGFITFAKTGRPNSRSTQLFINFGDNSSLDRDGFSPFGRVIEGMDVVNSLQIRDPGTGGPSD